MVVNDHKAKALIQNTEEVIQNTEKIIQNTEEVISNTANGSKAKKTIRPVDTSKIKKTAKAVGRVKTAKTTKTTTPVLPQKVLSSSKTLQSLREKIDKESYQQQSKEAYERFVKSKNTMPRSSTNFKQLPEAKAVEVNVNCNNVLNKSMMAMSGLLGGTIKCNSFNGSQKYINKRLDKLGIKDKKSD